MAKRNNEQSFTGDKAKIRVFFAEVEGNNQSVQDALKTMISAMNRPAVRVLAEQKSNGDATLLAQQTEEDPIDSTEETQTAVEEGEVFSTRKPRGSGKKTDRNAGLALVPDLNFRPAGSSSFKDFLVEKSPSNDLELALATVYYMQHTMALSQISASHVMTGFKEAGKAIPVDLRQTLRNIKKSKIWLNFTDLNDIKTTTQGDNFVEHDMGKNVS